MAEIVDVSPEILEKLQGNRRTSTADSREATRIVVKAEKGEATLKDANRYAKLRGEETATAIRTLSGSDLPNGQMYYNIAEKALQPVLEELSEDVLDVAGAAIEKLNADAGIGLTVATPDESEKIHGILEVASSEQWDDVKEEVASAAANFSHKCVDDTIRENAERQYEAGLSAKVHRTPAMGACTWCTDVAGTYSYDEVRGAGSDVWRRHANCDCVVEYEPVKGQRQLVSSGTYHQNKGSLRPEEREKRAEEKAKNSEVNRSRSVKSEIGLKKISKSDIINAKTADEAQSMLMYKYGFDVEFFEGLNALDVKAVLAGYDDFLTEFPEATSFIRSIDYDSTLKDMGTMSRDGFSRIGPAGLRDYGTGLHESAHALDFAITLRNGEQFSEEIVYQAISNTGLDVFYKSFDQIIGTVSSEERQKLLHDTEEIFAYSMETAMGGINNQFANEVYRLTKEKLR